MQIWWQNNSIHVKQLQNYCFSSLNLYSLLFKKINLTAVKVQPKHCLFFLTVIWLQLSAQILAYHGRLLLKYDYQKHSRVRIFVALAWNRQPGQLLFCIQSTIHMASAFNWKSNCWLKYQICTAAQLSFKPVVANVDAGH